MDIKLIATDVDGTLVKDSAPGIYPEIFDEIRRLKEKGIIFIVASGRQYFSVATMFEPVKDDILFIVQNGANVRRGFDSIIENGMDQEHARQIVRDIRSKGIELVVSTIDGDLVESKDSDFLTLLFEGYHNKGKVVEDVLATDKIITKVAAYKKGSIRKIGEEFFIPKWSKLCKCCLAGEEWVDFMDLSVDKGNALKRIQQMYKISPDETMVFGDNENDMGMLRAATYSYAVANARDEVKACANNVCPGYEDRGVLKILQSL